jgi:hypothetical protein
VLLHNVKSQPKSGNGAGRARASTMIVAEGELRSWAVQLQPSSLESALWQKRHVDIYNVDLNAFVSKVRECIV